MSDRLSLYNDALLLCGERSLANLSENREPRYLLDQVWEHNGVTFCLEQAQWFFAMRTTQIDYDPDIEPPFGYTRAFDKPVDWVLTSALCADAYFGVPLTGYTDEAGYWYSNLDTIYVRYVSNDEAYGLNLAGWPESFHQYVAAYFASQVILKISNDDKRIAVLINPVNPRQSLLGRRLLNAKSRCAMAEPTKFLPQGAWTSARGGGWGPHRDGGNTGGDLTG